MRKIALLLVISLFGAPLTYAYDKQRALDNLAEDVSTCVAYYTITLSNAKQNAEKLNDKKWGEIATMYEATVLNAMNLLRLTMTGKPEKFMESKIDLRLQEQMKIIEAEGVDRLVYLHADSCKALMENPDQRFKYWTDKQ